MFLRDYVWLQHNAGGTLSDEHTTLLAEYRKRPSNTQATGQPHATSAAFLTADCVYPQTRI